MKQSTIANIIVISIFAYIFILKFMFIDIYLLFSLQYVIDIKPLKLLLKY